ncbi:MAG: class C beta-lactamase-related serine hydrolase [Clostridia bacterium]|nr:serine hydrolase [Candidatus Pelethousia sp.]NCB30152.1 class C beta-lactamase-related serine hydrolase [Clostridia bacterium]
MDITLQMRSLELLLKLIKHDMSGVPQYGYRRQKFDLPAGSAIQPLPRCTPEEAGIASSVVERLYQSIDEQADKLGPHGVMLLRHGKVMGEGWWAPYRPEIPHMLYSMSKSVVGTAVGLAVDEGLLSTDELVSDIFAEIPASQNKAMRTMRVWHLLTMSSGSRFNEFGSMLDADWARMFLESAPKFEPGSAFEYDSMNTYMLAAIVRRKTGMPLVEYLRPRLFEPLGITRYTWETCPKDTEKGGWGLSLCLEDAAKLGQLYLQNGMWEGKRILSAEWIQEATRQQIATPNGESKLGYGYQIWINPVGYQFNGAFGQYVVVMPKYDAVAAIFSGSTQLFAEGDLLQMLEKCFWGASDTPLPDHPKGQAALAARLKGLLVAPTLEWEGLGTDPAAFDEMAERLDGREYRLNTNIGSIFPQPLQNVHGNYSRGTDLVRFSKTPHGLALTLYENFERNTLYFDRSGGFYDTRVALREETQLISTRGLWMVHPDEIRLVLLISFLETPDTCLLYTSIASDGNIALVFRESPSVEGAMRMLLELVGLADKAAVKRLVPLMKHVPGFNENTINDLVRRNSVPEARGAMVRAHDQELALLPEAGTILLPAGGE